MLVIVLRDRHGNIDHLTHGRDDLDTRNLFELLKETRNAEKIPIAELQAVHFGPPLERHTREL